jgi:hypothetical protein
MNIVFLTMLLDVQCTSCYKSMELAVHVLTKEQHVLILAPTFPPRSRHEYAASIYWIPLTVPQA